MGRPVAAISVRAWVQRYAKVLPVPVIEAIGLAEFAGQCDLFPYRDLENKERVGGKDPAGSICVTNTQAHAPAPAAALSASNPSDAVVCSSVHFRAAMRSAAAS